VSLKIERLERGYRLKSELLLTQPRDELFSFFADAANLESITPKYLSFRVLTDRPIRMTEGALINYRLRLHHIPLRWRTEIAVWEPPVRFVDRQLAGPYRWWIHEHRFEETENGTRVIDTVDYHTWLAPIVHPIFVRRDLRRIFDYRTKALQALFGESELA